ncbi:hypothetical protein [Aureliella helgolandensis]|uniref:Uncharacterized protein n=1 Tax=Aureliella helgolandensis TaxID=2527968 RepID=A0A518G9V0_9BACT|nr:hypothetical protein [Aureliella helgolandensis]QDV25366.1 hypothetical protein Q31a_36920 [Aureliella helgolandensis]
MPLIRSFQRGLSLAVLVTPFAVGCGGGDSANTGGPATAASDSTPAVATSAAAGPTAANENANSAAALATAFPTATVVTDGAETEASESVAVFLDALRRGNEQAANGVLTQKAREALAASQYGIQPLGTPEGVYKIGRVGFPYAEDQGVALVECTWQEPPVDDQPAEKLDIVCEVRKTVEGWRISSIAFTIPETEQTVFIDFEDTASLESTLASAMGDAPPAGAAGEQLPNQTANESSVGLPSQSMPPAGNATVNSFPDFPSPNSQPSQGSVETPPTQIAMPQFGAPVQR